ECLLHMDSGTMCEEYVKRWYYDSEVGACLLFWYGGCDGNSNQFSTEIECYKTCV
ncbi:collagen alpha-6(VI) chain, partial [Silurus meridionalis]